MKKNVCFCVLFFFLCAALLSKSSVFPVIFISGCLLFFSCNQTRRFISVALKHHQNQFPSALPRGRATVGDTPVQAFSFTHTLAEHPHRRTWHTHTHRGANTLAGDSPHHCFLMSYLLHLCNIHLSLLTGPGSSIYPFYLYPRSVSPHRYSQLRPPPRAELTLALRAFWKTGRGYCACEWLLFWCGVLEVCQTLGTGAVKRWSVISFS